MNASISIKNLHTEKTPSKLGNMSQSLNLKNQLSSTSKNDESIRTPAKSIIKPLETDREKKGTGTSSLKIDLTSGKKNLNMRKSLISNPINKKDENPIL